MKNKQGVTLIILVVIVLIMSALLAVSVINGTDIYNNAKKTKLQTEIASIEILVQNYMSRTPEIDFNIVELDISTYSNEQKAQFANENIVDNIISLYEIDLGKIDAMEVTYGTKENGETDRYLYSNVTKKVYYQQGRKIGGTIYHRIDK